MAPTIRELTPADAPSLWALYRTDAWDDRTVGRVAAAIDGAAFTLGAVADGDLVGSLRVVTDGVYYARLYDVLVHPDHRGQGVGHGLVETAVDHSGIDGVDAVTCSARESLVGFYEDCGFERIDDFGRGDTSEPGVLLAVT